MTLAVVALLVGTGATAAVNLAAGTRPVHAGLAAGAVVGWALARLAFLSLAAPTTLGGSSVRAIWAAGSLPYAIAFAPVGSAIAFTAGAWLAYRGARGVGVAPRRATWMVGLAFGSEILVTTASWILRAGVLLLLT